MKGPLIISRMRHHLETHHPSAFLLGMQLLLLILYALFDGFPLQRALISAINVLVLVLVIWVLNRAPGVDWFAWLLGVPAFFLSLASALVPGISVQLWSSLFEASLFLYAAGRLIVYMMGDTTVTVDELFAAGATFTLFAWGFAHLFMVSQEVNPASFISSSGQTTPFTFLQLLSVSFTNLSATGMSDITPVLPMARVIMMLEQFTGIGYVAAVVSRLIGMTLQRIKRTR